MSEDRLAQLTAMLETSPDDAFCLYGLAHEYTKRGDAAQAIQYFDRTIEIDPDQCYAYYHKARVLDDEGRTDAARTAARLGADRARVCGDAHALSELHALLDELA